MKCGMACSLFEVVDGKGKPTSGTLAALVNKLERDRMVSHSLPVIYQFIILRKIQNQFTAYQQNELSEFIVAGCPVSQQKTNYFDTRIIIMFLIFSVILFDTIL